MASAQKTWLLPLLILAPVAGCSDQAAVERTKSGQQFNDALASFDAAQSGYVPHHKKAPANLEAADLENYRQTQLTEAATKLQPLIDKGPDRQQLAARRLLADVDLSNAERASRNATAAWAAVTRDTSGLLGLMVAVDVAGTRAKLFETAADEARSLLDQENQEVTAARARQAAAEKQVADQEPKVAEPDARIKALQQESETASDESRSLTDKAFVSKGAEQVSLYRQADAAQRKADVALAQSREEEIKRDFAQSDMAIYSRLLNLARESTKTVEAHARSAEDRLNQAKTNQESALARKQKNAEQLEKNFADVSKAYSESVEAPFVAAEEKINHAVEVLTQGVTRARGEDQRVLQVDLLAARIFQASIFAQHVVSAASYQKTLGLLAGQAERSLPGKTSFSEAAKRSQAAMNTAYSLGKKAMDDGSTLATELAQSGGSDAAFMDAINKQREFLTKYAGTLTAAQTGDAPAPENNPQ